MKKAILTAAALLCGMAAQALTVQQPSSPIVIDGKLDEAAWKTAPKMTDFRRLKAATKNAVKDQTEVAVLADDEAVYLGVTCYESEMDKVTWAGNFWGSDTIEMFFSPAGNPTEHYQFAANLTTEKYSQYYAEGGNITPDKYRPFWESASSKGDKAWYLEVRIPYSAFYMTRNKIWNKTWLMNVARTQTHGGGLSTWSPLESGFNESKNFNKVDGFPMRKPVEDVCIPAVLADFQAVEGDYILGSLFVNMDNGRGVEGKWDLTVEVPGGNSQTVKNIWLELGNKRVEVKGLKFPASEKNYYNPKITLTKGDVTLGRYIPVPADYTPLAFRITYPQYANNYYPGQEADKVEGLLDFKLAPEALKDAVVELTIAGKTEKIKKPVSPIKFKRNFKKLAEGETVDISARILLKGQEYAKLDTQVARPKPRDGMTHLVWIEDGHFVENGKKYFPRNIYAYDYMGGTRVRQHFAEEKEYIGMNDYAIPTLSCDRLLPKLNLEAKEATKDVKPCKEYYDAIEANINKLINAEIKDDKKFYGYYICDEPECRNISAIYLKYAYDYIKKLDPFHPVVMCTRAPQHYINCADVFMMHTYISPMMSGNQRVLGESIEKVRAQTHEVTDYKRPDKVAGFTGQFFSYAGTNKYALYPTWEELMVQSWTTIANGSKVNYPYAYHDIEDEYYMFEAFCYINKSIEALNDLLLSGNEKYLDIKSDKKLDATLYEENGVKLLIMVNPFTEPHKATISDKQLKGTWYEFRGDEVKTFGKDIEVEFQPYQVYVYTTDKNIGKNLPSTKEILAKIKKANDERDNKGNLLLHYNPDYISLDASYIEGVGGLGKAYRKLFDGSTSQMAWATHWWNKQQWLEIDFPKVSPKFNKITVYGLNLKNMEVQIWKAGEWKKLVPIDTKVEKWCTTLTYDKLNKSVKVKLVFSDLIVQKETVEVYEVEMYDK